MTTSARSILFVDHAGVMGGAEFSLLDIAAAFASRARVVLLADGPFHRALEARGITVEVDPLGAFAAVKKSGSLPPVGAAMDAVRVARRLAARAGRFDVIYANSQKAFVVSVIAGWIARRPVVWHLRDILAAPHFSAFGIRAVVWLANHGAARVIANSRATADAFVAAGGRPSLVHVVHNGIDSAPFDAVSDEAARACRAELGIAQGVPVVLHVGRFHHWKGQQVLLEALAREPRPVAWFVGAPLFGEDAFADELRATAIRLGVSDRVKWLGFRDDVALLMRAADVVVHSSVYPEPFGRVVVEAMLAGTPVIAARAGGVPEIVTDGETGRLVAPGDPSALAKAIGTVLDDPSRAREMAARAGVLARERFTRNAMVGGVSDAIASL